MRIGINTLFLIPGQVGGTETYLRGLIFGLSNIDEENEYILYTNKENHNSFEAKENFSKYRCNLSAHNRAKRVFYEQLVLPKIIKRDKIDVLHSPGYISPILLGSAKVVTIHDMQYHYYPHYFAKTKLLYWKYFIPLSARYSDVIVAVSKHAKKNIVEILGIPEEKVIVTFESTKFSMLETPGREVHVNLLNQFKINKEYILSVAALLPHKNLDRLINAFSLILDKVNHQIVLVGLKGQALKSIGEIIEKKGMQDRVILTGYVADHELLFLYKNASLFVLPSLFEGFGIPVLEAMSVGCPVAASNRTSIPEVLGDAGMLFEPEDESSIADAIYSILSDTNLRNKFIERGLARSKMFSWPKVAKETLRAYRIAYDKSKSSYN